MDLPEPESPNPQPQSVPHKISGSNQSIASKARSNKAKERRTIKVTTTPKSLATQLDADLATNAHFGLTKQTQDRIKSIASSDGPDGDRVRIVKGIEVPMGYPETEEGWRDDVTTFLRISVWKASRKLATSNGQGIESIKPDFIATPMAICIDKLNVLTGQPTAISFQNIVKVDHTSIREKLTTINVSPTEAKASK